MGLRHPQKKSVYPHLDRLLFYTGLAVLIIVLPLALREIRGASAGIPVPGADERVLAFTQWWQDEWDPAFLPGLIREFEAYNPGIRVELDTRSYSEVRGLLLPGAETDAAPPGIVGLDARWLPALNTEELFENLEPLPSDLILLFYHTELLEKAGFDRPPKSQTEFSAAARALTDPARGLYGYALALKTEDSLGLYRDILPWFRSSGAALLAGGGPAFTASQAIATLRFLDGLYREGLLAPAPFAKTGRDLRDDFIEGRLAMMLAPAGTIASLREAEVPFGLTTIPGPDSYIGKPVAGLTAWYAGIPRSSPYKDEARAFLAFLTEKAEEAWGFPDEPDGLALKVRDIYAAADTTEEYLALPAETALEAILREELRLMFEKGQSPEETAAAVQMKWEAALQEE
jgi:multiple sugar transport system substrate-binding protein